jgi:hypothetical protein
VQQIFKKISHELKIGILGQVMPDFRILGHIMIDSPSRPSRGRSENKELTVDRLFALRPDYR